VARADDEPIYLTAEGRQRLEQRLAAYEVELRQRRQDAGGDEAEDTVDEATDLEAADNRIRLGDLVADLRSTLDRAQPLLAQPDDGVIRQGATVRVRDAAHREQRYQLVDGAEVEQTADQAAVDSPVGRALLGHQAGDRVAIRTPSGERVLTVLSVEPYGLKP
jgi:transcription elongation factor GreA